jgi:uncharacterized protein
MNTTKSPFINRLALEKSPYLLQHQHNPVDWYPWGEEAFQKAREEHKPIFLSIGYSTCHWCHVMERESFENEEIAQYLNAHFVCIKVDREERPDVDKIYMTAVQAISGQGGWPLNVFLTPDLKLFYGGTYFPTQSRHGLPGFLQLLHQIQQIWTARQPEVKHSATELHRRLTTFSRAESSPGLVLTPSILHDATAQFADVYDAQFGGFGPAPKFPRPSLPLYLLRYGVRYRDPDAVDMVLFTCDRMMEGGIHDQLGGGFARYSVDAQWLIPHFEKMLYDNAQMVTLYLDAFLVSGNEKYALVVRDTLEYVRRDMTHPDGGFYSAEDADSEGKEGKFYCWTLAELTSLLTDEELAIVTRYFGVTPEGNFIDHSDPQPLPHQNVLHIAHPELTEREPLGLASAREKMFAARQQRARPHRDDKILVSWNGLMLGAFARAYGVLGDDRYRQLAERNLAFIRKQLWDPERKILYHRWRDGAHDTVQLLAAYAFLISGALDLYEATLIPAHLDFSLALADQMITQFYDAENGGFWQTPAQADHLVVRMKDDYDGAEPGSNSVAIMALLRLAAITGRADLRKYAEHGLRSLGSRLVKTPEAAPYLLSALDFWLDEPLRVVIAGDPHSKAAQELLQAAHSVFQPNKIVLGHTGAVDPFAQGLAPVQGKATAYVCTGTACQLPTSSPGEVQKLLR